MNRSAHKLPLVTVLALSCLVAGRARAGESSADKAAADALFKEGRKLLSAKKYDEACPKFEESLKLSERLGTLLNLATCHEAQRKTASAWAEFNQAAALARQEKRKDREKYAKDHADKLEPKLERVSFTPPKGAPSATLSLDGTELGASVWGTPLPIDPGKHEVSVSARGKKTWHTTLEIGSDATTTKIEVPALEDEAPAAAEEAPSPRPAEPPPAAPAPKHTSGGGKTLGWVALGVGVVGVGVGSYFGLRTFSKKSEANDHCGSAIGQSDSGLCDPQGVDLRDQAKSSATLSTIGFAVGAVGVGAGVVLLLSSGESKSETSARALWLRPSAGPTGAGLSLGGRL